MKKLSLNEMEQIQGGGFTDCALSLAGYGFGLLSLVAGVAGAPLTGGLSLVDATAGAAGLAVSVVSISRSCPMNN
ncbi:hypothetical protein [Thermoflexibacter ruber]|uniref:Bacteriocin-type signal sequence-containing protein n=1 Tax=Thermoflexibacter ruber TaxID=1003 RepID=A0A1I2J2A2_9BACT|nr:hypothetical protein [Thermoflexibacter ruber]SFF47066.1 bacteriocin-type signal sequence-containing protein [Thermoflexibacter ruber]